MTKDNKTSEAQRRTSRAWEKRNKEKTRIDGYRRQARNFIRNHAKEDDLLELEELIKARRENLKL